jgi:hypothetical protein
MWGWMDVDVGLREGLDWGWCGIGWGTRYEVINHVEL